MAKIYTYLEAKIKIEYWCAYQERCQFEVNQKLKSWGLKHDTIQQLVAELISSNFVDEERFAEAYVSGKFRIKRWGKIKIRQHLKAKYISDYSIDKAIKQISQEDYQNTLSMLIRKKAMDFKATDTEYRQKAKIHTYLGGKGYEFEQIESAYQKWLHIKSTSKTDKDL